MKTEQRFIKGMLRIGFVFLSVFTLGCTNNKAISESCQQASLDTWTNEFISRMNQGYLPDEANQIAEVVSVKTLARCMDHLN